MVTSVPTTGGPGLFCGPTRRAHRRHGRRLPGRGTTSERAPTAASPAPPGRHRGHRRRSGRGNGSRQLGQARSASSAGPSTTRTPARSRSLVTVDDRRYVLRADQARPDRAASFPAGYGVQQVAGRPPSMGARASTPCARAPSTSPRVRSPRSVAATSSSSSAGIKYADQVALGQPGLGQPARESSRRQVRPRSLRNGLAIEIADLDRA